MNELVEISNKKWQQEIVEKFPESCSCGYKGNFRVKKIGTGIGTKVTVQCLACQKETDITPYELW